MAKKLPAATRFINWIERSESGCWLWQGTPKANGYGHIVDENKRTLIVHRFSYEMFKGKIPDGLTIDHLCCVKMCVNPAHLEAVTIRENERRAAERSKFCNRGHPRTEENTYIHKKPQKDRTTKNRCCRECMRITDRARRMRERIRKNSQLTPKEV